MLSLLASISGAFTVAVETLWARKGCSRPIAVATDGVAFVKMIAVIPIFNGWKAAGLLLETPDSVILGHGVELEVVLIDDASTEPIEGSNVHGKTCRAQQSLRISINGTPLEYSRAPT
jgi:hypothetical protein